MIHLQEADFQRRELLLKQRDIELQESLVRFSKFLQESDAKMARATKTAAEERRLREEKTREAEALVRLVLLPLLKRLEAFWQNAPHSCASQCNLPVTLTKELWLCAEREHCRSTSTAPPDTE